MVGREMQVSQGEFPPNSSKDEVIEGLFTESRSLNNLLRHHAQILDSWELDKVNPIISTQYCKLAELLWIRP